MGYSALKIMRMYAQANGFQKAAERCLKPIDIEKGLPIQAIVCYSLACEILLKTIYAYEHPEIERKKGHSHEVLFEELNERHQEQVKTLLRQSYSEVEIKKYISESSKLFEEYRYIYEQDSDPREHIGFVSIFSYVLMYVVHEVVWRAVFQETGESAVEIENIIKRMREKVKLMDTLPTLENNP